MTLLGTKVIKMKTNTITYIITSARKPELVGKKIRLELAEFDPDIKESVPEFILTIFEDGKDDAIKIKESRSNLNTILRVGRVKIEPTRESALSFRWLMRNHGDKTCWYPEANIPIFEAEMYNSIRNTNTIN